jgi:ATP-dependent DNA helicase RecQ
LSFNEQVFLPSIVRFTTDKNGLYEFEKKFPTLEPLVKSLLRAYEAIFDYPCSISELLLAKLLKKDAGIIKNELQQLHRFGIIEYKPQKDSPQLFFPRPRVKAEELSIDKLNYGQRKENLIARIDQMIRFISSEAQCRSKMIGLYFGDNSIGNCGICDNCLRLKKISLNKRI